MRTEIQKFAEIMDNKLNQRQKKYGGDTWREFTVEQLLTHLEDEVRELKEAVGGNGDIASESADVANMAMFVLDVCGGL